MIDADIDHNQGAVHTPGLKDPHCIRRDPGDHAQRTGNHCTGENLHHAPQTDSQDQGPDRGQDLGTGPLVRTGILGAQAVALLPGDSHLNVMICKEFQGYQNFFVIFIKHGYYFSGSWARVLIVINSELHWF